MKALLRIRAIFAKELAQLKRDRMTFGMIVMIPLIQLLLFGFAINTNIRQIPAGVVDFSQTGLSRILVQTVSATQVVTFTHQFSSVEQAEAAIANAEIRAVLIIPADLSQRLVRHPATGFGLPPASDEETSRPLAQWLADGSDTIIAGAIKTLRAMPLAAQYITEALPATHFVRLIRGVALREVTIVDMTADVYWLARFTLAGLAIASLRFKKRLD